MQGTKGRGFNPARRKGSARLLRTLRCRDDQCRSRGGGCEPSQGAVLPERRGGGDERGLATFQLLRHRRNEPQAFLYAFDLLAAHTIEARLSRWLLRCHDLLGSDEITLTQEFLGDMLGVRRTSVSLVAYSLQQAGLIRYRRGRIRVIDREGLQETACECYETVKAQAKRLLGYPVPRESLQV